MKFSVVIPAHNEEKHIEQAIKSLLNQKINRGDYEIIAVDNNSTDKTSEIAKKSGADKVILETKRGTNMARNRGYLESEGEIIAFLDADSIAPANWLSKIENDFKDEKVAAVSGPFDYGFKGIKNLANHIFTDLFLPKVDKLLLFVFGRKGGVIIGGNFAVKKEVLDKIGGLPPLMFWGDDAIIAMIISRKKGRVVFDPKIAVKSSPRRFEKEGMSLEFSYIKAFLKAYFTVKKNGDFKIDDWKI